MYARFACKRLTKKILESFFGNIYLYVICQVQNYMASNVYYNALQKYVIDIFQDLEVFLFLLLSPSEPVLKSLAFVDLQQCVC